jgi:azurin
MVPGSVSASIIAPPSASNWSIVTEPGTITVGDGGGGDGPVTAERSIARTVVGPGETTEVTVEVDVSEDRERLSITESFDPAFASVSSPSVSFEGGSGSVTITSKTDSQAVAAVSDVTAGTTVVMTYDVTGDAPGTTHSISGTVATGDRTEPVSGPGSIDVVEGDFEVSDLETPASVSVGESFSVSATVTNTGDAEAIQTVELRRGGETVDSRSVTLGAGESTSVTFDGLSIDEGGTFTYRVSTTDDTAAARIDVTTASGPVARADTDGDGKISDIELQNAIVGWAGGAYTDAELQTIILAWAAGG